jgi:glycosyltransferase involved in cell wall biosynthesis
MQEVKISVIIPNYNRSALLKRATESVLSQTYPIHEVLICDDGSEDNSKEVVRNFNSSKVIWIDCGKNGRPAIPRNIGIRQSTGEFIAFLDNDDYWHPEKIEKQIWMILNHHYPAVCSDAIKVNEKNEFSVRMINFEKNEITFEDLTKENCIVCSSMLINRQWLMNISLFPEEPELKAYEDFALWIRLSHFGKIGFLNEPLVYYSDIPSTSIRTQNPMDGWGALKIAFDSYLKWTKENNIVITNEKKVLLKNLYGKISRKGHPTFWEELNRKIRIRLEKYLGI